MSLIFSPRVCVPVARAAMQAPRRRLSPAPSGSRHRPSSCPTQASLLRGRGELGPTRISFEAQLSKVSPNARPIRDAPVVAARLGMGVLRAEQKERLLVSNVDSRPRNSTPVAQYNTREERNKDRGGGESHASMALVPGDRIRAVNNALSQTGMLAEIAAAASDDNPKEVNLAVSRDLTDVLKPLQNLQRPSSTPVAVATGPAPARAAASSSPAGRRHSDGGCNATTPLAASRSPPLPRKGSPNASQQGQHRWIGEDSSPRSPSLSRRSGSSSGRSSPAANCSAPPSDGLLDQRRHGSKVGVRKLSHAGLVSLAGGA